MAAERATGTTPIVFILGSDPVRSRIVESLSHPGRNITGVSVDTPELLAKRLEVLNKFAPKLSITALVNPENPNIGVQLQYVADTTNRSGILIEIVNATGEADFGRALNQVVHRREAALLVANDGFLNSQLDRLVAVTTRYAIPAAF